ncbi:ankyrin [Apiospora arundinis]
MCQKNLTGPYPCGHVTETWEYCDAKRRRAVLHNNPLKPLEKQTVIPCAKPFVVEWPPKLNTPCARTCLTKPFMCCRCGLVDRWEDREEEQAPQVGWTCEHCEHHLDCVRV